MKLAIFDLDGTILRGTSCERLLFEKLYRERIIGRDQLWAYAGFLARWWTELGPTVIKRNKSYLAGLETGRVEAAARDLVENVMPGYFDPRVAARIGEHRETGDAAVLLTGAPQFLAEPLGLALGMKYVIGSRLEASGGVFTGGRPLSHPFGREKARLAEELCGKLGCRLGEAAAYADSNDDLPLLESVGRPVVVCPDRRLRKEAEARGWEVIP